MLQQQGSWTNSRPLSAVADSWQRCAMRKQQARGGAAVRAIPSGTKVPASANSSKNLAVRRCMIFRTNPSLVNQASKSRPSKSAAAIRRIQHRRKPRVRANSQRPFSRKLYPSANFAAVLSALCGQELLVLSTLLSKASTGNYALPFIFAHHQRTPTNKKRQSWKNSGDLPSKAWPIN